MAAEEASGDSSRAAYTLNYAVAYLRNIRGCAAYLPRPLPKCINGAAIALGSLFPFGDAVRVQ